VFGRELYQHSASPMFPIDMDCCENANLASDSGYSSVIAAHHTLILKRYKNPALNRGCPFQPTGDRAKPSLELL
jgi:hypothetical protein